MKWFQIARHTGISDVIQPANAVPKNALVHFLRFIYNDDWDKTARVTLHSMRAGFRVAMEYFGASEEITCILGRWSLKHLKKSSQVIYLRPHPREVFNWITDAWATWVRTKSEQYPFGHRARMFVRESFA